MGGLWPPLGPFTLAATAGPSWMDPYVPSEKSIVRGVAKRLAGKTELAEAEPTLAARRWRTKAATPRGEISIASLMSAASSVRSGDDGMH